MSTGRPTFTIVMATLNAAALLRRTLDSLFAQTFEDWELEIADGASRDDTVALVEGCRDPRVRIVSEPDRGIADAWNKALARSSGRWVIFLGAGDTLPALTLQRVQRRLPEGDDALILVGDTALESADGHFTLRYARAMPARGPRRGFPFMHPACVTARAVFAQLGPFDTGLRIAIDSDLLLRAWTQGVEFRLCDHTVVMLEGGVSDRRWLAANLEYAACVARELKLSPLQAWRARCEVRLRAVLFKQLKLSGPLMFLRRTLIFGAIAVINGLMRVLPTFTLRRALLRAAGCRVDRSAAVHRGVRLFSLGRLSVGPHSTVNRGVYIDNRRPVSIGSNVSVAHDVRIYTQGHDIHDPFFKLRGDRVEIHDRACLFAGAVILPGVTIGEGAVVLPATVVQRDLPPYSVVRPLVDVQVGARAQDLRYELDHRIWLAS